ncbi:MAG: hypothetical protein AAFX10_14880, partial [Pseudomonadota bacterium]
MKHPRILMLAVLALAGCSGATAQDGYETLLSMNEEIRALARPTVNDGVPDLSPAAVEAQRQAVDEFRGRLLELDTSTWSVPQQVDYLLVWSKMNDI